MGNVAHLVDKYDEECDGQMAYQELIKWYEGEDLTTETAEDNRLKLDELLISSNSSANEYINNLLQYIKLLDNLGETFTTSKTIRIFFDQINDQNYAITKETYSKDKLNLS